MTVQEWAEVAAAFAVAVYGVIKFWGAKYIEGRVAHQFDRQLEKYKHDLEQVTAAAQYDYQRKLHDFQKYSEKRHLAYVEIYRIASLLRSALRDLDERASDVAELLENDKNGFIIQSELTHRGFATSTISRLRDTYQEYKRAGKEDAAESAARLVGRDLAVDCRALHQKLFDTVANDALYLTASLDETVNQLIVASMRAISTAPKHDLLEPFNTAFVALKRTMKKELSIGDYELPQE